MNIFIRFEDKFGCLSLFNYSASILNKGIESVTVRGDFGCNDVFSVSQKDLDDYDYIILVFDMDNSEKGHGVLTPDLLKNRLIKSSRINCVEDDFGIIVQNKLILIPVFFCFETIPLFSQELCSYLLEVEGLKSTRSLEMLDLFRSFYDICSQDPEVFEDILNSASNSYLDNIRIKVKEITGDVADNWTVQGFYATYYREILKSKFSKFNEEHNGFSFFTKEDKKKMRKNTDYVFSTLIEHESKFNPHEILDSFLATYCQFNTYLQWLYSVQNLKELESMTYKNTIKNIMQKIDEYNYFLKGIKDMDNKDNEDVRNGNESDMSNLLKPELATINWTVKK